MYKQCLNDIAEKMNLKCFVTLNPCSKVNCKYCLKNVIEDHFHGQNIRMG